MNKRIQRLFYLAAGLLTAFIAWTFAVCFMDVQEIGPLGSAVGFATLNQFVHEQTGVNIQLYDITDWLSLIPLGFVMGFAVLGLTQWIQRKYILKVDYSILVLGGFYAVVMVLFVFFEQFVLEWSILVLLWGVCFWK